MLSERQIRKQFKPNDVVEVTYWLDADKSERRRGILESLLSVQYYVEFEDGGGAFYFYKDASNITLIERDGKAPPPPRKRRKRKKSVEDASETPLEAAMKPKKRRKTPSKK